MVFVVVVICLLLYLKNMYNKFVDREREGNKERRGTIPVFVV